MYANRLGRFTSPDPLLDDAADWEIPQSWNLYSYVINNPSRYTDPTGMIWVTECNPGCGPRWIPDDEWKRMTNKNMYALWTDMEYNSTDGRVRLDPNGPTAENPDGYMVIGPNVWQANDTNVAGAIAVAIADGPEPGPADLLALAYILGSFLHAATVSHEVHQVPIVSMASNSKHEKDVASGLLTAAERELEKLRYDPPTGGARNHHKSEIKTMVDQARRRAGRLVGKAKEEIIKKAEEIEKTVEEIAPD